MKPTVLANAAASASAGSNTPHAAGATATNGITIPINHEYGAQPHQQQQHYQQQPPHPQQQQQYVDPNAAGYGSPSGASRQFPAHFQQGFGFEPDMDDMFARSRLGRMQDPFAGFATRKRCGNDPHAAANDSFSHYFDDDPDFGFPQFGTLGRRRAAAAAAAAGGAPIDPHANVGHDEHDFFNRLPTEFRQYIPEGFGVARRSAAAPPKGMPPTQSQAYYAPPQPQHFVQPSNTPPTNGGPQSPSKKVCDAAIQTEDPTAVGSGVSAHSLDSDQLNQHGLRNTIDMGVKSVPEGEDHGPRSHSAPPKEQLQQQINGKRPTPPPAGQYSTQTSPQVGAQQAPFQKVYYPPQQQAHPQQKQQTPPAPQTPGGTYVRTIPIFVEGRSEPIINSHKEIPNQNTTSAGPTATASASARAYVPHTAQQQQQHFQQPPPQQHQQYRPTPLNTQQQETTGAPSAANSGLPPQTPHTLDSINKIQDIQRDVLDLMGKVEKFGGKRQDKEYAYLDEMLTRNLLKLDTIDTNGKDSIRLARKEAIKCIQASINVLEAKAEENARMEAAQQAPEQPAEQSGELKTSAEQMDVTKEAETQQDATEAEEEQPVDATKIQEPIPLPPPEGMQVNNEESPQTDSVTAANSDETVEAAITQTKAE